MCSELSGVLSVQLPYDSTSNALPQQSEVRKSFRVLVVDDDALVRARLSALLRASQYEVEEAATGEEALHILDSTNCHMVLTDWQMPDMDGLELCRHIRLRDHENYIYVLMLTIRNTEHDVMVGLAAGADDYMVKGAANNEFLARLEIGRRIKYEKSHHHAKTPVDRRVSRTDPVTDAHTLGYLIEHLRRELARSQRYGHALAILQCDINEIKPFTDRFGYQAADALLRALVAAAAGCIRKGDWLARTGGAAFMIVLPETNANGARCAAHKLRQVFAQPLLGWAENINFAVTIAVTAVDATRNEHGTAQIDALLRAASGATHADKRLAVQANVGTTAWTSGESADIGEKNGIN